jgi:hypothetical protein
MPLHSLVARASTSDKPSDGDAPPSPSPTPTSLLAAASTSTLIFDTGSNATVLNSASWLVKKLILGWVHGCLPRQAGTPRRRAGQAHEGY